MFLATTALSEFWDKDQEILFLGSWCLRHDRRNEWEKLNYQVMPTPWNDRDRFYDACEYLDACSERMLNRLTDYLNAVHGVSHSKRYWRILIGPWLLHYLHATYDRYARLKEAFDNHPTLQTIVLDARSFGVPRDTFEAVHSSLDDPYNLQIFSQLLEKMGYSFPTRTLPSNWQETANGSPKGGWRTFTKGAARSGLLLAQKVISRALAKRRDVAICDISVRRTMTWALAWRMGLRALPYVREMGWSFAIPAPAFDERRNGLAALPSAKEFERIFMQSLPQNFPTLYLEGYQSARGEILKRYRRIPVIVSATAWYHNEPFKFLAAEASQKHSRLITVQSGGGYGIHRFSAAERHESRLADSFMVWGWADNGSGRMRNLPSPKLSPLLTTRYTKQVNFKSETILFVSTAHLRYLLRFHSFPIGIQTEEYFQWHLRFLTAVSDRVRRAILFRLYSIDYGHGTRDRIMSRFRDIQWDDSQSFYQRVKDARLVVIDHSGTTFLEALRVGVPTILFWDPRFSEVRDEAEPYVEDLRKVGILWDSAEAAAAKVEEIYDDPWAWWGSKEVQEVRERFVDRYALARKDWVDCWAKALEEEVALSQVKKGQQW